MPELALPSPSSSTSSTPEGLTHAKAAAAAVCSTSAVAAAASKMEHRSVSPVITIDSVGAIVQKVVIDPSSVCIENVRAQETDSADESDSFAPRPVRRMSFALLIATEKLVTVHHVALLQRAAVGSSIFSSSSSSTLELLALDTLLTISSEQLLSGFYIESCSLMGITRELQTQAPPSLAPAPPSVLLSPTSPTSRLPSVLMSSTGFNGFSVSRTQQLRRCAINFSTQPQANYCEHNQNQNHISSSRCFNAAPSPVPVSSICSISRSSTNRVSASASTSPDEAEQQPMSPRADYNHNHNHCVVKRASLRPSISMIAVSGCDRHNPPLQLPLHLQSSNSSLHSSLVHLYTGSVYTLLLAEILDAGGAGGNYASGAASSASVWSSCGRASPAHFGAGRSGSGSAQSSPSCAAQLLFFTKYARTPVLSVPIFDRLFRSASPLRSIGASMSLIWLWPQLWTLELLNEKAARD